jgi:hypothetical protein
MKPGLRKLTLSIHLVVSVGWVGAVFAYMALDIAAATSQDALTLRSAYVAMDVVVGTVIVPLAIASLLTGLVISLGTRWGLFRHYWVLISLVLTVLAVAVLLAETRVIGGYAQIAGNPSTSTDQLEGLGNTLLHSVGGTVVLLVILVLNVYKPRGMTRYGWRKQAVPKTTTTAVEPPPTG